MLAALTGRDLPARKKIHREPTAFDGLHDYIDTLLGTDAEIRAVSLVLFPVVAAAWNHGRHAVDRA